MPFSLYIHIPYCLSKCPYCDFNAYAVQTWPEERYVDALCAELQQYVSQTPWQGQTVETLYFGGGTPSLFTPASIERFFNLVARLCPLALRPAAQRRGLVSRHRLGPGERVYQPELGFNFCRAGANASDVGE